MVSATKSSSIEKWPTEYIAISAMTSSEKSKLRNKLKLQLHQVRSAIKDIDNYYVPKKTRISSPTSVLQSSPCSSVLQSSPGKAISVAIRKVHLHFRERNRAAARIALQQMKKTVHIYEDAETLKEIERVRHLQIFGSDENPLELLGLYLKKDYIDEEEEEELRYMNCEDLEEGLLALLISQAAGSSSSIDVAATGSTSTRQHQPLVDVVVTALAIATYAFFFPCCWSWWEWWRPELSLRESASLMYMNR